MKLVGIDLAASGVRGVVLRSRPGNDGLCVIDRLAYAPYPSGEPGWKGLDLQSAADMQAAVSEVLRKLRVGRTGLVVGYRGPVYVEEVAFKKDAWQALKNPRKQESALRNHRLGVFEIAAPEVWRLSWRTVENRGETALIEVGAVNRDDIAPLEQRLRDLGVEPRRIDANHAANIRAYFPSRPDERVVAAICDLGAEQTTFTVTLNGNRVLYNQVIASGGNYLTEVLARHLPDHVDADAYKRATRFNHTASQFFSLTGADGGLESAVNDYALQLFQAYDEYTKRPDSEEIGLVFLIGGGARLHGLRERMQSLLGLDDVYVASPRISPKMGRQAEAELEQLAEEACADAKKRGYPLNQDVAKKRIIADFATAVGLALAGGGKNVTGDNT